MIVGIDFGTCYSNVAVMVGDVPITDHIRNTTKYGIPTEFLFHDDVEYYGVNCHSGDLVQYRGDIITRMKKLIREDQNNINKFCESGGKCFKINEVIEKYLTYLLNEIKNSVKDDKAISNKEIEEITIAAPVGIASGYISCTEYNQLLKETLINITKLPENKVKVIDEPVAAAIAYLYEKDPRKMFDGPQTALVFDLGGGTLDISIVQHDPISQSYEIMKKDGNLRLGGDDWDDLLKDLIISRIDKIDFNTKTDRYRFDEKIRDIKLKLSEADEIFELYETYDDLISIEITRNEFEEATKCLLDRCMTLFRKVMDEYLREGKEIHKIVLVGGSSNMPQIRNAILRETDGIFGPEDIISYRPSTAIAEGAAIFSYINNKSDLATIERVMNIASHSYGVSAYISKTDRRCVISNVIYKNAPFKEGYVEADSEIVLSPSRSDIENIILEVYESDELEGVGENKDVISLEKGHNYKGMKMAIRVPDRYLGHATDFKVRIKMRLSEDGILQVTAIDRKTKETLQVVKSK